MTPRETVEYVAELARLNFSESEIDEFAAQFQKILSYVGEIEKLDLDSVEPLRHISETSNVFREDVVGECLTREEALRNAPNRNESFFKVPKVIASNE
jgi:aspartyl-tRNA(Asn)/glutamyl-tRNA(Gln) amidotransferase subunit C